ncbi:MAG: stage II sporulation protein P [Clostridiales bacterium]|nr:stage II sporulation protein P [Clostridiales bacterium]
MKKRFALLAALLLTALWPWGTLAAESGEEAVYRLKNDQDGVVAQIASVPDVGDEYIASDNAHYRVTAVEHTTRSAVVERLGVYEMPDVSWLHEEAQPVSAKRRAVAIYCTHSDESYKPTDGKSSDEKRGGIYDVAERFKAAMEKKGITVYYSDETHYPHDAGAYRRSRATAASLVEQGVDAVMDIHRDGIPDPAEYEKTLQGDDITRVRLLVGRSNQNAAANKQFATQIKAVADEVYPGLIKDIYVGKGTYNQDLMPQAVLLEFGTYTNDKEAVLQSTGYMADVMNRTLYGGVSGAAGSKTGNAAQKQAADREESGAWKGIAWVIGALVLGALAYAFIASGRGGDALRKWKRTFQEMTGGLFGGKKKQ